MPNFKTFLSELKDEDTQELIPSVMRFGDLEAVIRFHHDPDFSDYFSKAIESDAFKREFAKHMATAFTNAMRVIPQSGGDRWYDDVSVQVDSLALQKTEIDSTDFD